MYKKKSVSEMIATEPYIRSKFRKKTYDGWQIIHIAKVDTVHNHYWYYLRRYCESDKGRKFYETATLSGETMRAVYRGERKIADVIKGKVVCGTKYKHHILQNTIMAKFTED